MEYAVDIVFHLLQYLAVIVFFDAFLPRNNQADSFWLCVAAFGVVFHLLLQVGGDFYKDVQAVAMVLLFYLVLAVLYRGEPIYRLFIAAMSYALFSAIDDIVIFAGQIVFQVDFFEQHYTRVTTQMFVRILAAMLFAFSISLFHKPADEGTSARKWTALSLLFPLSSIVLLSFFYDALAAGASKSEENPYAVIALSLIVVCNLAVLFSRDYMKKSIREHEMLVVLKERERTQKESISALSAAYQAQRKMTHDFQKHLSVLSDLLENGNAGQASSYLSQLRRDSTERILLVDTHHAAVDAILNQKGMAAQQNKIDIRFEVNDLSGMKIKETDCTVVLGNLLDNAIEACEKLPERERWIQVSMIHTPAEEEEPGSLFLSVLNASPLVKISSGQVATTKENASFHGFGLRNVQDILKKYQADYDFYYENGQFVFSVEWPECNL